MPAEIPECLTRRYQALDGLIRELSLMSHCSPEGLDPSIKLMCNFWNILKDDPGCNLTEEIQQYFSPPTEKPSCYSHSTHAPARPTFSFICPQNFQCYMAQGPDGNRSPNIICPSSIQGSQHSAAPTQPDAPNRDCRSNPNPPLTKVLTDLQNAASFDKNCNAKLKELLAAEKQLKSQIARLEDKEKEGIKLMKEADLMWAGMEDSYKEKIAESLERQNDLMKQLQDIERSAAKWRKNKRDLESQLDSINKCQMEMVTKINQKTNDLKSIDSEIAAYKKRIENTKKETEAVKKAMVNKKQASDGRIAKLTLEISSLEKQLREENKQKKDKEMAGKAFIQEARTDLQKICKVLLQRRLEYEDLEAEKIALLQEINMLKDTCDNCKDRCAKKQTALGEEIKRVDIEIANFKLKCTKCNVCVDSRDARTLCSDCPRCEERRQCIIDGLTCKPDAEEECVCAKVKRMFLNNVFENMSTVLEKKIKTNAGKALGSEIMKCMKTSRNGKLNDSTKRLLQEFVLQTVKKNLNLTVVGGAVKTRCELDPDIYKQLLLCLNQVKATPPPKSDKGCDVKKDPCQRWGGERECNCPKGPKNCICTKKAPPPVKDPATCPPEPPDDPGEKVACPHKKETPCGPDCGAHSSNRVGAEVAEFRPDPCSGQTCPFGKNMRAAQCVLGPESLIPPPKTKVSNRVPDYSILKDQSPCKCGRSPVMPSSSSKDAKQLIANQINKHLKCCKTLENTDIKSKPIDVTSSSLNLCKQQNINKNKTKGVKGHISEDINPFTLQLDNSKLVDGYTDALVPYPYKSRKEEEKIRSDLEMEDFPESQVSNEAFIAIRASPSGSLTMELHEFLFNHFEANFKEDEDLFVYLKITDSGKYYLDMHSKDETSVAKLLIKLAPNGAIAFEIVCDQMFDSRANSITSNLGEVSSSKLVKVVKRNRSDSSVPNLQRRESLYLSEEDQRRIRYILEIKRRRNNVFFAGQEQKAIQEISKLNTFFSKDESVKQDNLHLTWNEEIFKFVEETVYKNHNDVKNLHVCRGTNKELNEVSKIEQYDGELKQFYIKNNMRMNMDVIAENGISTNIDAYIKKTSSGNIALDVGILDTIGEISNLTTETPILIRRSPSGNYQLFIRYQFNEDSKAPNAVLRRTESNGLLVIITEPETKAVISERNLSMRGNDVYKVKMTDALHDNGILLPVVLKTSPSFNYFIVMDKEFEKKYTNSLNSALDENGECYVELHKTGSTFSINFESDKKNAMLVKSPLNNIKLLVNGPLFEHLAGNLNKPKQASKYFEDLLSELNPIRRSSSYKQTKLPMVTNAKSSSDTNFYKNIKIKDSFLAKSTTKFQRTESGQYAAILNKESKRSFINNLQTQIANSPKSLPIKRTESGEITIMFDPNDVNQSLSLKITPSGNLYVVVDKNALKDMVEKEKEHTETCFEQLQFGSEHMIKKIIEPKDKATTISCNAKPEEDTPLSLKKIGVQSEKMDKQKCGHAAKPKGKTCNKEDCDLETCAAACCSSQKDENSKKYCSCLESTKENKLNSYFFTESLYRYKDVCLSKEIIEVTSLCKKLLNDSSSTNSRISLRSHSSIEWNLPNIRMSSSKISL